MSIEEQKAVSEAANELGPRLQEELRAAFPLARMYGVTVAYGAGLDKSMQLAMRFNIQSDRRLTKAMSDELTVHAQKKLAEWKPGVKAAVACAGPGRMD